MDIKEIPKSIMGYNCILVCVYEYTNCYPLVNQEASIIADAIFIKTICEYVTSKAIICDEVPTLTSDFR